MSHTKDLVQEAFKSVDDFLNNALSEELDELSVEDPFHHGSGINHFANKFGIHVMKPSQFHKLVHKLEKFNYPAMGKMSCFQTLNEALANPDRFDKIYEMLVDEESKKTFDWFIKYRTAYAFIGNQAYDIFTPRITKSDFQEVEKRIQKISDNKYKIDNFSYKGNKFELITVFYFEQYAYSNVKPSSGDVIMDCGACFGDTALWFSKYVGQDGKVYAFEPMDDNFKILSENIKENSLDKIVIPVKKGVGEKEDKLKISGSSLGASVAFGSSNGQTIEITSIDKFVEEQKIEQVDFIKMDIEGAELGALKGSENTLKKFKPKLAICVYHKGDDLITIPKYIKSVNENYKFFMKHNTTGWGDTVLYAINAV